MYLLFTIVMLYSFRGVLDNILTYTLLISVDDIVKLMKLEPFILEKTTAKGTVAFKMAPFSDKMVIMAAKAPI